MIDGYTYAVCMQFAVPLGGVEREVEGQGSDLEGGAVTLSCTAYGQLEKERCTRVRESLHDAKMLGIHVMATCMGAKQRWAGTAMVWTGALCSLGYGSGAGEAPTAEGAARA